LRRMLRYCRSTRQVTYGRLKQPRSLTQMRIWADHFKESMPTLTELSTVGSRKTDHLRQRRARGGWAQVDLFLFWALQIVLAVEFQGQFAYLIVKSGQTMIFCSTRKEKLGQSTQQQRISRWFVARISVVISMCRGSKRDRFVEKGGVSNVLLAGGGSAIILEIFESGGTWLRLEKLIERMCLQTRYH
jgi:hypothetical protein